MALLKMKTKLEQDVIDFLLESNAIEGVYDDDSMQQAVYAWEYLINQKELNRSVVCKTHKILMLHQPILGYQRGYFRDDEVMITGSNRKLCAPASIPYAMEQWCQEANNTVVGAPMVFDIDPNEVVEGIKIDHVRYETIHPFIDGNGRTGRMFMNWQRVQVGLPILVIKEDDKYDYYKWFE